MLHLKVCRSFDFLLARSRITDFHDVELLGAFSSFLLTEAEHIVLVISGICHRHVGEARSKTFEDLLLSLLCEEKLHVTANFLVGSLINTNEVAPFLRRVDSIIHDLACAEFGFLLKDSSRCVSVVDVGMEDVCLTDNTKFILADPAPESD